MKYRKHEAKDYAKSALKGVWTAIPYYFTADDRLDECGNAANLEHCITQTEENKQQLRADLEAAGLLEQAAKRKSALRVA